MTRARRLAAACALAPLACALAPFACGSPVLSIGDRGICPDACADAPRADAPLADAGADAADAAVVVQRTRFGIVEDVQYVTGAPLGAELDAYADLGVAWMHFQLIWNEVEPNDATTSDWTKYDALVGALISRGIRPLVNANTAPPWAQRADCAGPVATNFNCPPADPNAYASFVGAAAARWAPKGVHAWEIFSAPNTNRFWASPSAPAYAAVLCAAYHAIHAADPSAIVLAGGTNPVAAGSAPDVDPVTFLDGIYAAGGGACFDALGFHPMTAPDVPPAGDGWGWMLGGGAFGAGLFGVMTARGDGAKQIWATEYGASTAPSAPATMSEAQQAALVDAAYRAWSALPRTGPLFWFRYQDPGTDPTNADDFFGVVRADGTHKPAYAAYKTASFSASP